MSASPHGRLGAIHRTMQPNRLNLPAPPARSCLGCLSYTGCKVKKPVQAKHRYSVSLLGYLHAFALARSHLRAARLDAGTGRKPGFDFRRAPRHATPPDPQGRGEFPGDDHAFNRPRRKEATPGHFRLINQQVHVKGGVGGGTHNQSLLCLGRGKTLMTRHGKSRAVVERREHWPIASKTVEQCRDVWQDCRFVHPLGGFVPGLLAESGL